MHPLAKRHCLSSRWRIVALRFCSFMQRLRRSCSGVVACVAALPLVLSPARRIGPIPAAIVRAQALLEMKSFLGMADPFKGDSARPPFDPWGAMAGLPLEEGFSVRPPWPTPPWRKRPRDEPGVDGEVKIEGGERGEAEQGGDEAGKTCVPETGNAEPKQEGPHPDKGISREEFRKRGDDRGRRPRGGGVRAKWTTAYYRLASEGHDKATIVQMLGKCPPSSTPTIGSAYSSGAGTSSSSRA